MWRRPPKATLHEMSVPPTPIPQLAEDMDVLVILRVEANQQGRDSRVKILKMQKIDGTNHQNSIN